MKPLAIVTALFLAPLLLFSQELPSPPPAQERAPSEAIDDGDYGGDTVDTSPALADEVRQLEAMLRILLKLNGDDLLTYAAALQLPEPEINSGVPKFLDLKREFKKLQEQGLTPKHPAMVAKAEEIDAFRKRLTPSVVALRGTLQAKLEIAEARYKRALATQNNKTIQKALDAQDYIDAKRDYESELEMLQAMHIKRHGMQDATEADLAELDHAIQIQDEAVGRTGKVLAQIAKAKGIIYHHPNEVDYIQKPDRQPPHAANPFKIEKACLEAQLKFLTELGGEALLTFAGNLDLRDNPVAELHRRQLAAALDLDELTANGLGGDHPQVVAKTRSIKSLKAQLNTAIEALRETLQAQLTVVNAQLAALNAEKPAPAKPE